MRGSMVYLCCRSQLGSADTAKMYTSCIGSDLHFLGKQSITILADQTTLHPFFSVRYPDSPPLRLPRPPWQQIVTLLSRTPRLIPSPIDDPSRSSHRQERYRRFSARIFVLISTLIFYQCLKLKFRAQGCDDLASLLKPHTKPIDEWIAFLDSIIGVKPWCTFLSSRMKR